MQARHDHPRRFFTAAATLTVAIALLIASALATSRALAEPAAPTPDVINGQVVPNSPSNWPFMVAVLSGSADPYLEQYCGGSLIAANLVLTAAHCVAYDPPTHVLIGQKNLSGSGGEMIAVDDWAVNPAYDDYTYEADSALLTLENDATLGGTVPLSTAETDPAPGATVKIAGWGNTSTSAYFFPEDLYEAPVTVHSNESCFAAYGFDIFPSSICAAHFAGVNSRDTCQGDSGGPLVYNHPSEGLVLAGITSWGFGCAEEPYPGVYTRVSSIAPWVDSETGPAAAPWPTSIDFGVVSPFGTSVNRTIQIDSVGIEDVTISDVSLSGAPGFAITANDCGGVLPVWDQCSVGVSFSPIGTGSRAAKLIITTDAVHAPKVVVDLSGLIQAPAPPPAPTVTPASVGLKIRLPKKAKRVKKKPLISMPATVEFVAPPGIAPALACVGTVRLSLRAKGSARPSIKNARLTSSGAKCIARFSMRLPRKARGKRVRAAASFSGNASIAATSTAANLRVR